MKKHYIKKLFAAVAVLLCCITANAHDFEVDGIYYNLLSSVDLTVKVTYKGDYYDSFSNEYSGDVIIPSTVTYKSKTLTVTSIGGSAFYDCSGLTSITIPNSVTSIGSSVFSGCSKIKKVELDCTTIGTWFSGKSSIEEVVLGDNVTSIGYEAFEYCSGLTSVTIGNSVTSIGSSAFYSCSGLTSVTIGNSVTSIGESAFAWCDGLTSITIPNSVTSIGRSAFEGCSGLTSVTIGNSVTSIGGEAFSGCSGLTSITIPNSVTSIGGEAFSGCSGLTSITIPNSVTSIGDWAFYNCSGLTSVTIGNSVTSIGDYAFNGCTSLKDLRIEDGKSTLSLGYNYYNNNYSAGEGLFYDSPLETLYLGRNLSYDADWGYGYSPFYNKTKLASVTIGNSVTSIGDYAFYGCDGLTSITIPNSVTSIGERAFSSCSGLTSITIGNSVTSIGDYAFYYCSGITNISLKCTTPPVVGSNNFTNAHFINSTVYVPQGALEAYQTADVWKDFWDIQELGATDEPDTEIKDPETKKCAIPVISYENGALTITSATEGANFITEIRNSDVAMHYDSRIELTVTYDISTYATLAGYENSDIAMATLCWIDEEGIASDLTRIESTPVIIKSYNGNILLDGAKAGTEIVVYDINGINMGEAVADGNEVVINTSLSKNDIAIVHIGNKAVKIIMQ